MNRLKVMTVFGTRPEAVKMSPLVKELQNEPLIESFVCVTAQHREMLDQILELFDIIPDYDLDIMKENQSLTDVTIKALMGIEETIKKVRPDIVLVHGDTTTTFSGSLAAFYCRTAVGHVEAGLRTYDKYFPYPEEINRRLTGIITDIHFAPTAFNKANLVKEGINPNNIFITGNTVIDAMKTTIDRKRQFKNPQLKNIDYSRKIIAVTAHRRENLGNPLENICLALRELAIKYKDVEIVYPVHLNPAVRSTVYSILSDNGRIHLTDPLDLEDMHNLLDRSYMVLTDSGGLQEEAPALGKPVLVLRNETERPEAVHAGTVKIAGTDKENILTLCSDLIDNESSYNSMAKAANPYGDGNASSRIRKALLYKYGLTFSPPEEFAKT